MSTSEQEQEPHTLQAYRQTCREENAAEARAHFIETLAPALSGPIISASLVEVSANLTEGKLPLARETCEEDIALVRELCKRGPVYTTHDVQTILPALTALCGLDSLGDLHSDAVIEVLSSLEGSFSQPDMFAQCQEELKAFYARVDIWGEYRPLTEAYRLRGLIKNLLALDNVSPLESLLRSPLTDTDEEQARTILSTYQQEYWYREIPQDHPIFELLRQQTGARLKAQLIQAVLRYVAQHDPTSEDRPETRLIQALTADPLPWTGEDIRELLPTISAIFTRKPDQTDLNRACFAVVDTFTPLLRQPDIQASCQSELIAFYEQVRVWKGNPNALKLAYQVRLLLEDLLFAGDVPGMTSVLRAQAGNQSESLEEQARTLLAMYYQEVGDANPWWGEFHPALDLLRQGASERVKVWLIRVVLPEVYPLSLAPTTNVHNQTARLIADLSAENLPYTAEDIQNMLQSVLKVFSTEQFSGNDGQLNWHLFELLQHLEPYFNQADNFAACQAEVEALYALTIHWGHYTHFEKAYSIRMMLGKLLYGDSVPGLATLLRDYARAEGPSIEEQARNCLAAYHQELNLYTGIYHPVQELLVQQASSRLKARLIGDALREAYDNVQVHQPSFRQSSTFKQSLHLVSLLLSLNLPYSDEDIRSILESFGRIFALNERAYRLFDMHTGHSTSVFHEVFEAITPRLKQPETLAFCRKEAAQFYYHLSQCQWTHPDRWENTMRLQLRGLLFPESAGPLLDLLRSGAHFESESELQSLLTAYHQDLACGTPGKLEAAFLRPLRQKLTPQTTARFLRVIAEEGHKLQTQRAMPEYSYRGPQDLVLLRALCQKTLPFSSEDIYTILHGVMAFEYSIGLAVHLLLDVFADQLNQPEVLANCSADLALIGKTAEEQSYLAGSTAQMRQLRLKLQDLSSQRQQEFRYPLLPDTWASPILDELASLAPEARNPWLALLNHCAQATKSVPASGWLEQAGSLAATLESSTFTDTIHRWISLFSDKKGGRMDGNNSDILRGLLWLCIGRSDRALAAILADAAIEGYRKLPGEGPRCPKAGDAAVTALEGMRGRDAIAQLERVRRNVKQPSYQARVGQALDAVAQREQMSRLDLEELMIPTFDLRDGQLRIPVGSWMALLTVESRGVQQQWIDDQGKQQESLPAALKREAKEEVKALARLIADIEHLVSDQRNRLERLFLNERQWTLEDWRERYLEHPLLRVLARRLIWQVRSGSRSWRVIWHEGTLVDSDTRPVELPVDAEVTLWHPLMSGPREAQQWCIWLETQHVTQPFKQAHREIYPLTAAERTSGRFSRRFADHFIRQHQLGVLARARGWRFSLHSDFSGSISDDPVSLELPHLGIRAEFEVHRQPEEDESISRYLVTSQVRFSLMGALPEGYHQLMRYQLLEQVPPLIFSEIMRDIDLFVSVASVGADPHEYTGPGPLREYWQAHNQEELSSSALARRVVLERLVPMLEIGERCALEDRFLRVRGDLCTYRIHLGSGNIIMEPGQQYLCIVFNARAQEASDGNFFLPFEGDQLLALILSKAFLLAADTQIKDQSILKQIRSRRLA